MNNDKLLIVIGAGGHGSVIADLARLNGYTNIQFLDDADIKQKNGYPVVGKVDDCVRYISDAAFSVAIGNNDLRAAIHKKLSDSGAEIVSLIHPHTAIGENVTLGQGTVIMAGVVINPGATVREGVILNTCCSVDHDCIVGSFSHISVNAHLCGTVTIGKQVFIGAGVTVINNVSVCDGVTVGAGATVVKNIAEAGTYIGTPARRSK